MIQSINLHMFRNAFANMGRKAQFTYEGQERLFNYLEDMSEDTGEEYVLDVIGLCCDYSEERHSDIASSYSINIEGMDSIDAAQAVIDWLDENTTVVACCDVENILYCSAF